MTEELVLASTPVLRIGLDDAYIGNYHYCCLHEVRRLWFLPETAKQIQLVAYGCHPDLSEDETYKVARHPIYRSDYDWDRVVLLTRNNDYGILWEDIMLSIRIAKLFKSAIKSLPENFYGDKRIYVVLYYWE